MKRAVYLFVLLALARFAYADVSGSVASAPTICPSSAAPTNNQVLTYSASSGCWAPADASGGSGGVTTTGSPVDGYIALFSGAGTITGTSSSLPAANVSGLAPSATTDTTNASNISSGTLGAARLPNPSASTLGGTESLAATSHQWINAISTAGVPGATQPACSDLSNAAASCSTDTTNASNIASGTLAAGEGGTGSASAPTSGQLPVGNSGGTAYAPQSASGACTLTAAGLFACHAPVGWAASTFAAGATSYTTPGTVSASNNGAAYCVRACTLALLTAHIQTAPATGQSVVVTVQTGSTPGTLSASAVTCTIAAATNACSDSTHSVSLTAGQAWTVQFAVGATNATGIIANGLDIVQ